MVGRGSGGRGAATVRRGRAHLWVRPLVSAGDVFFALRELKLPKLPHVPLPGRPPRRCGRREDVLARPFGPFAAPVRWRRGTLAGADPPPIPCDSCATCAFRADRAFGAAGRPGRGCAAGPVSLGQRRRSRFPGCRACTSWHVSTSSTSSASASAARARWQPSDSSGLPLPTAAARGLVAAPGRGHMALSGRRPGRPFGGALTIRPLSCPMFPGRMAGWE
jgi:hypothetical protein